MIVGVGLWNVYRGLSKKFEDKWRTRRYGHRRSHVGRARRRRRPSRARCGLRPDRHLRSPKAAIDYDPKDAIGLDGALRKLADATYGPYLLGVTAAGLVCYGLYCLVDSRYRDVSTAG